MSHRFGPYIPYLISLWNGPNHWTFVDKHIFFANAGCLSWHLFDVGAGAVCMRGVLIFNVAGVFALCAIDIIIVYMCNVADRRIDPAYLSLLRLCSSK